MWAPRPPPAASSASAGAAAAQNPSAAASAPPAARVREEGEVSSGADDDEVLQIRSAAASTAGRHVEAGAQVLPSTFLGKGSNTLSLSNIMAHKTAGPGYKKTMRVNQGQFKPGTNRSLTWQKPVSSDNLVITFSDDDSGPDSEKAKQDRVRDMKASSEGTQKTGTSMQTRIMREEASRQKTHNAKLGSTNFPAFPLSLRNAGAGRGSGATFIRKELPLRQVTPLKTKQKDGNGGGVNSADHKLERLRHKIAAKENELKGQKRPMVPAATKNADICNDQARLLSEKKGLEASNTGEFSDLDNLLYHAARPNKRLKLNQQHSYTQVHSELVTVAPVNSSSGANNMKSSEVLNHFDNGIHMNRNTDETEHRATTEPSDQIQQGDTTKNLPSAKIHHKSTEGAVNHDEVNLHGRLAAAPLSGQSIPADTSALVPVTSSQVRQRVPPVGASTVSNRKPHLEPGEENADPFKCNGQIGGRNSRLFSLLEMEELQERELEDAQEHRRKCEVEEREALRAYRRAQRALLEANERCAILHRKREIRSAQVHGLLAENSSLVQSLSIQNAGEGLAMPSLLSSQIHADSQMLENQGGRYSLYPEEPPQQPVDKHEARPHSHDDLTTSSADPNFVSAANDNNLPSNYMADYLFPARQARSECAMDVENRRDETIHVYAQENRQTSGDSAQDYELLEASLRSRLVERFGKKPCLNSTGESNEERAVGKVAGTERDKGHAHIGLQLQEAEQMTTLEGTVELGSDGADCTEKTGDLSNSSSGLSMGNCEPEDNISSLRELYMSLSMSSPKFPSSAPQNAARHIKWAFPGFCKDLTNDATSEATESIQDRVRGNVNMLPATLTENAMTHSGIDPFWPFCMFELRGKCNDEECQWQHAVHHSWRKSKHTKHATTSVPGRIPYGLLQHMLPVPAYRVGSNLIKADLNLMQSVLANSLWQYWQRGFCASFPLPLSVQRILPSGAPFLQAGDGSIADSDSNRQLLNFRMLDSRKGAVDVELFLEAALVEYCGKAQKPDRVKALLLLARSIEADPSTVILWVFYLHIYYQKDEGLGKDDMFSHAVQHNVYSYELWLMYINSRLRFDDRLDAYNDALSMLSQMTADTDNDLKERSASILDIFLQMIYFLCMSGNVEKAISRIFGILPTATHDNTGDKLLADVISCLTMSDRCIFWISCLYVSIYRKLPEEITNQLECQKALPHALVWPPIESSVDNRSQIIDFLTYAAEKMALDISESVKNGDPSYLMLSQFLTVNHISCLAALQGFKSSADMLVKYMEEYPMCPQILLFSARLDRKYATCPGLKGFDELLSDWPREVQGIQYLWNQYIEHVLSDNIELAEKLLACWYEKHGEDHGVQSNAAVGAVEVSTEASGYPSLASAEEVGSGPSTSDDQVYGLLNLSLYKILEDNIKEALVAVDKALKSAHEDCYEHCLREHAAIHILEKSSAVDAFNFIIGYLGDHRNLPTRELLSRRFCKNVKKNSLKQLIDDTIGPPSVDSSLINSVLEVCFGPSLLPEKIGKVKYLVDFVESVMEVLPANYRLTLAVGRFVAKHYTGADPTSMGTRFWAGSVLINSIFRSVPVAPESVWLEAADLLEKLHAAETVKRFHQQATSVYPFSFKLWHAYLKSCKASGSNAESIMESARQRGIELNLTS
ncbi:hypothetical protein EJB05_01038 [Eragrostis curvula]|uniref:Putative zinc-finger domain-containing protein n=1 Tax=Eragrostis curvula TaxID=38414 RepID=A0A5J9WLZ7_9POAL|nr:hypothetical protein EJB05_01038 [Eragrostis curvula]